MGAFLSSFCCGRCFRKDKHVKLKMDALVMKERCRDLQKRLENAQEHTKLDLEVISNKKMFARAKLINAIAGGMPQAAEKAVAQIELKRHMRAEKLCLAKIDRTERWRDQSDRWIDAIDLQIHTFEMMEQAKQTTIVMQSMNDLSAGHEEAAEALEDVMDDMRDAEAAMSTRMSGYDIDIDDTELNEELDLLLMSVSQEEQQSIEKNARYIKIASGSKTLLDPADTIVTSSSSVSALSRSGLVSERIPTLRKIDPVAVAAQNGHDEDRKKPPGSSPRLKASTNDARVPLLDS